MFVHIIKAEWKKPLLYFCIGFCLVLMASWFPIFNGLDVFMQYWRVEIAAALFLAVTLAYALYQSSNKVFTTGISRRELNFIVLPLAVFVLWSALSILWSPSWRLALSHTLVWAEYLIFYLVVRRVLESPKSYRLIMTALSVMVLIIATPAIIEYYSFIYFGGTTTLGIRFAKYGEPILLLFPLIAVGVLRSENRHFALGVFVVTMIWLFMLSTLGRTNLILFVGAAAGVTGLVFLFKPFHRYRRKTARMLAAMILTTILLHSFTLLADEPNVPIVERVSSEKGMNFSNNFRKLMVSVSLEAIAAHPFLGIGAGNYGILFNDYRTIYAAKNPDDGNLTVAEDQLAERSHNEFLQIFAELGAVGSLIFLWFLSAIGIMFLTAVKRRRRVPPLPLAALLGLALFLASSAVSSYSFRFVQNGLVFFLVLAVAAKFLLSSKSEKEAEPEVALSGHQLKIAGVCGIAACLLLIVHCSIRVTSVLYTAWGNQTPDIAQAVRLYQTAAELDGENPNPEYLYGERLVKNNQFAEAVPHFKRSIALGLGPLHVYSNLATAQTLSGDAAGAENDFAEAVRLYPHSAFARTRYAILLRENGNLEESERQLILAFKIDKKSANTWWFLMNRGVAETTRASFGREDFLPVMDLTPRFALAAVLSERSIRFPSEKVEFNFDQ